MFKQLSLRHEMRRKQVDNAWVDLQEFCVYSGWQLGRPVEETLQLFKGSPIQWKIAISAESRGIEPTKLFYASAEANQTVSKQKAKNLAAFQIIEEIKEQLGSDVLNEPNVQTCSYFCVFGLNTLKKTCFLRYLIASLIDNTYTEYFTKDPDSEILTEKPGVQFHMYISKGPCGDVGVFTLNFTDQNSKPVEAYSHNIESYYRPSQKERQNVLRAKKNTGEGAIPVENITLESRSEENWKMSCSDKILKWNALGLQGRELSEFFEPIKLSSIVIGTGYHSDHVCRALCCRGDLDHHLRFDTALFQDELFGKDLGNKQSLSIIWDDKSDSFEKIDGSTGLQLHGEPSSISRESALAALEEYRHGNHIPGVNNGRKRLYIESKMRFYELLKCKGLGKWIKFENE